eukprot:2529419-Amphidinium_carterae.1
MFSGFEPVASHCCRESQTAELHVHLLSAQGFTPRARKRRTCLHNPANPSHSLAHVVSGAPPLTAPEGPNPNAEKTKQLRRRSRRNMPSAMAIMIPAPPSGPSVPSPVIPRFSKRKIHNIRRSKCEPGSQEPSCVRLKNKLAMQNVPTGSLGQMQDQVKRQHDVSYSRVEDVGTCTNGSSKS